MLIEIENLAPQVLSEIDLTEKLLALLEDYLVDPLVAGGAPRDWFFNQASNDIDVFVKNDKESFKEIYQYLKTFPLLRNLKVKTTEELPEIYRSDNIYGVITFYFEFKTFQIIGLMPNSEDFISNFPCSISKISYKDFILKPRPEFISSVRAQHLTFYENANELYVNKIRSYFSNWRYTNLADFEIRSVLRGRTATAITIDDF